jgi:hypothetical protein
MGFPKGRYFFQFQNFQVQVAILMWFLKYIITLILPGSKELRREAEKGFPAMDEVTAPIEGIRVRLKCYGFGFDLIWIWERRREWVKKRKVCV